MDRATLLRATLVATLFQLAMVIAGHFVPWIALHAFMLGGMGLSAIAGFVYGRDAGSGYGWGALGGAIAGAACALVGIAVSVALKDTLPIILVFGTAGSGVAGAIGGLIGQALAPRHAPA